MALKITSATRVSAAPCDHWNVVVTNELQSLTHTFNGLHRDEISQSDTYVNIPWWAGLALLWLRARLAAGFSLASSVNLEIVG